MKRILMLTLSLLLLFCAISVAPSVSAEQIIAAEDDVILLAGSDFQVSGNDTSRIKSILNVLSIHGLTKADGAFFVGDYTAQARETETSAEGIEVLKNLYRPIVGDNMIFTQGNHDPVDTEGLAKEGNNDPASGKYGVFVIHENQRMDYNWDDSYDKTKEAADALDAYLDEKAANGWTKPIFVLNHIGLHWSNRTGDQGTGMHAELLVNVLNEAGDKGLNVIYLYGHNHSGGYDDALGGGAVYFKKGDQIEVPDSAEFFVNAHQAKKKHKTYTINFTYMNAGFIGYYSTTQTETDAAVTMSVFLIRGDEVIITRYDGEINLAKEHYGIHNLKSAGTWNENYLADWCAVPNTTRYASSRKVTATDDVEVESPRYSPMEVEDPEEEPVLTTTTTKKPVTTLQTDTSSIPSLTTTYTSTDTALDVSSPATDPSQTVTEPSATATVPAATSDEGAGKETATVPKRSLIGLVFGIGGGIIIIGIFVFALLRKRKSK